MISTLQKLVGMGVEKKHISHNHANFNANLPINVKVLQKIDASRYRLQIGRKELSTKSQKQLNEGETYWGDFAQGEAGILTLSHLYKQPNLFQNKATFLDAPLEDIIGFDDFSLLGFQDRLLNALLNDSIEPALFHSFSYILLALNKGIVHLPLWHGDRRIMVQFRFNDTQCHFYVASENMGPLEGILYANNCEIYAMYEKSLFFLKKQLPKLGMMATLGLKKEIHPLFDTHELTLDMKG